MSFSDFFDSEFVTPMTWVDFSFLHPSSQEVRAKKPTCPSLPHVPQLLVSILPNACCCYWQSPLCTCKYNVPDSQRPPNQGEQCLWVSFRGILPKPWRKSGKNYVLLWTTLVSLRQLSDFFLHRAHPSVGHCLPLSCVSRLAARSVSPTTINPKIGFLLFFFPRLCKILLKITLITHAG